VPAKSGVGIGRERHRDLGLTHVFKGVVNPVAYLITNHAREADSAGLGKRLQPRSSSAASGFADRRIP
jgi:hypothetical protein